MVKKKKPPVKNPANRPTPRPTLEGNEFWRLRSKHGRDKLFATPALMLEAAIEYFKHCDDNPWKKAELVRGKRGYVLKDVPVRMPYTLMGFCLYVGANTDYWRTFK